MVAFHVYSAWIENKSVYPIRMKVQYKLPTGRLQDSSLKVAPNGGRVQAEERTMKDSKGNVRSAIITMVAIELIDRGGVVSSNGTLRSPWNVKAPTRDYEYVIQPDLRLIEKSVAAASAGGDL